MFHESADIREGGQRYGRGIVQLSALRGTLVSSGPERRRYQMADLYVDSVGGGRIKLVFRVRTIFGRQFPQFADRFVLAQNGNIRQAGAPM